MSEQVALPLAAPGTLTAFRWSTYDVPFWVRENTRSGRWNRTGHGPTQYWSLTPEAAWAELIRQEGLEREAELHTLRMPFWVCRVPRAGLVDLHDPEHQARYGIEHAELVGEDWSPCQRIRLALERDARGVLAPSAALPSHANLTLFGPRRAIRWTMHPVLASALPTTIVAVGGPPAGVLAQVERPSTSTMQRPLFD